MPKRNKNLLLSRGAVTRVQAIATVIIVVAAIVGAGYYLTMPRLPASTTTTATATTETIKPAAEITVETKDITGEIDPNVYGHFIEHLGRCIYGGIWVGEDSSLPNLRGMRLDVLNAIKALKPPIIRWPGGNFVSGYNWEDGIGPRDKRPMRPNRAWGGTESNQFGTDEFIDFCREVGTEPYICVNVGSGTPEEAANWVEYCNGNTSTPYGERRAVNGHPEPYNVKYWSIGNEMYGSWQIGHMNAGKYAQAVIEFAEAMKKVDPTIKLIAVGWYPLTENERIPSDYWNRKVLEVAGDYFDYLSLHVYYWEENSDYYTVVACPLETEKTLKEAINLVDVVVAEKPEMKVKIALDEWNVWKQEATVEVGLAQTASLYDGIFAAGMFHVFQRLANNVTMANLAQLVNVLPAIVTTDEGEIYVNPIYLAFKMYIENTGRTVLKTSTKVETFSAGKIGIFDAPFLDVSATTDEDGTHLYLAVINRHQTNKTKAEIELKDFEPEQQCEVVELNAESWNSRNDFSSPETVRITSKYVNIDGESFTYTFEPHSVTILKLASHVEGD